MASHHEQDPGLVARTPGTPPYVVRAAWPLDVHSPPLHQMDLAKEQAKAMARDIGRHHPWTMIRIVDSEGAIIMVNMARNWS
jgi:hypothetical protein